MVIIKQENNRLRVECTKCKKSRTMTASFPWQDIDAIMCMCAFCFGDRLVYTIRQFQRDEGNPDCFAKSERFCDQHQCKFRQLCLGMDRRP